MNMNTKFELTEKFVLVEKAHPSWSSVICFIHSIRRLRLPLDVLEVSFDELVHKDDYVESSREGLLDFMASIMKKKAR